MLKRILLSISLLLTRTDGAVKTNFTTSNFEETFSSPKFDEIWPRVASMSPEVYINFFELVKCNFDLWPKMGGFSNPQARDLRDFWDLLTEHIIGSSTTEEDDVGSTTPEALSQWYETMHTLRLKELQYKLSKGTISQEELAQAVQIHEEMKANIPNITDQNGPYQILAAIKRGILYRLEKSVDGLVLTITPCGMLQGEGFKLMIGRLQVTRVCCLSHLP